MAVSALMASASESVAPVDGVGAGGVGAGGVGAGGVTGVGAGTGTLPPIWLASARSAVQSMPFGVQASASIPS